MVPYGAFADILICFDGTLIELAEQLAKALNTEVSVENDECPPYELVGSSQAIGWDGTLTTEADRAFPCFRLQLETEECIEEKRHGRMFDLSPWLARFVSLLYTVDADAATQL